VRAGVDGRIALGNDKVTGTLLNQSLKFDPGGRDASVSGFWGLQMTNAIADNLQSFSSVEVGVGTEEKFRAGVQIGIKLAF